MTIVHGKIESLKQVRAALDQQGIDRFNSIGDINFFLEHYEFQRNQLIKKAEKELESEIQTLASRKIELEEKYDAERSRETKRLKNKINALQSKSEFLVAKDQDNIIWVLDMLRAYILKFRVFWLKKRYDKIIHRKTLCTYQQFQKTSNNLEEYTSNKNTLISQRTLPKTKELARIKEVVDGLYPKIAGAIGEDLVVKELKKLSDKHILFNDFTMKFNTPVYNKKTDDKIMSVQVDHLLVTNSGIFMIETKNWSKKSIESLSLRSPVDQIKRTSYALFVIMNSRSNRSNFRLKRHHWGEKEIPIRNLIVMINNKPKEKFTFVQVKTLDELNSYIDYFEPIFDETEVSEICHYLDSVRY